MLELDENTEEIGRYVVTCPSNCAVNWGSVWRGIKAQRHFGLRFWKVAVFRPWDWWCHTWTPVWHEGRGPYLTLGLGFVAIYRGY